MSQKPWTPIATRYNPIEAGSIDGTDTEPHDKAVLRALMATYEPDPRIKSKPKYTIFIGRLDVKTTEERIREVFLQYGEIRSCRLVRDIVTGLSRCYAFVEYEHRSDAAEACSRADGMVLDGRKIFVDHECERRLPGWVPRRLGGGFGGDKRSGQLRFGGKDRPFRQPLLKEKH